MPRAKPKKPTKSKRKTVRRVRARKPLITVVMPVFNGEKYLQEAIESVLRQSYENFELLIHDDGSNDASLEILHAIPDKRVRVLPSKGRLGLFRGLNRLIREARGEYLQILCQDDRLESLCLAEVVEFFENHEGLGFLFSKANLMGSDGELTETSILHDLPNVIPRDLAYQQLFYHGCIPGNLSTVAVRKDAILRAGLFDENLSVSADYDMWARMTDFSPLGVIHKHLVWIRCHDRQLSRAKSSGLPFIRENQLIRHRLLPKLPSEVRGSARYFEERRHHVQDFHYALRAFLTGRLSDAYQIYKFMGPWRFFRAMLHWSVTMNNRLTRPQADWILPKEISSEAPPKKRAA